jgi:hypothetical protein
MRFYAHGERVTRTADGRPGVVKDITGLEVNLIWDDDGSREWVPVADLQPADVKENEGALCLPSSGNR